MDNLNKIEINSVELKRRILKEIEKNFINFPNFLAFPLFLILVLNEVDTF